jgi:tripartite-type tricarboxylate transporter receptor subunit TctC
VPKSPLFIDSDHAVGGPSSSLHIHALRAPILEGTHMKNLKLPRRKFLHLAAGAAALPAVSRFAWAQGYPSRPVRIIVGFPPGGPADFHARLMGQWLSQRLGQQFVVENRTGAGGNLGTEAVVRAPADGYTLHQTVINNSLNATLYDLNFNFIRDTAPIARFALGPQMLLLHPSFVTKTVTEFVALIKANPGKFNIVSGGVGTTGHLAGELFKRTAGLEMPHVPYRGEAPALIDMVSGHVQVMFASMAPSFELIKAGKLRAIAVTAAGRSAAYPDIPTVGETIPGYEVTGWAGMSAPKGTPAEIISKLNAEINAGLMNPNIKARYEEVGYIVSPYHLPTLASLLPTKPKSGAR